MINFFFLKFCSIIQINDFIFLFYYTLNFKIQKKKKFNFFLDNEIIKNAIEILSQNIVDIIQIFRTNY